MKKMSKISKKTIKEEKVELVDKVSIKAGRIVKVKNTYRPKFSHADGEYFAIWVEDADGKNERCFLLTDDEMAELEHRSLKNKEDWTKKSFWTDMAD